jgi:hypothetical protein
MCADKWRVHCTHCIHTRSAPQIVSSVPFAIGDNKAIMPQQFRGSPASKPQQGWQAQVPFIQSERCPPSHRLPPALLVGTQTGRAADVAWPIQLHTRVHAHRHGHMGIDRLTHKREPAAVRAPLANKCMRFAKQRARMS